MTAVHECILRGATKDTLAQSNSKNTLHTCTHDGKGLGNHGGTVVEL